GPLPAPARRARRGVPRTVPVLRGARAARGGARGREPPAGVRRSRKRGRTREREDDALGAVPRDHVPRRGHHPPARAARARVDARRRRHHADGRVPGGQRRADRRGRGEPPVSEASGAAGDAAGGAARDRVVVVTGATGFLGEHLCRVLVAQGRVVRGLARSRSAILAELGVEHVRGDVLEGPELDRALAGAGAVFHLAGAVSRDPDDAQRMMRLHVDGTRRVLERMHAAGIKRMILASTSGTIGVSKDEAILDESAPYAEDIVAGWPYYASKIYQER